MVSLGLSNTTDQVVIGFEGFEISHYLLFFRKKFLIILIQLKHLQSLYNFGIGMIFFL